MKRVAPAVIPKLLNFEQKLRRFTEELVKEIKKEEELVIRGDGI